MTPAAFWILVGLIACFLGAVIIFWATTRHDGVEPDSRPLHLDPPSQIELAAMKNSDISFIRWRAMSPAMQSIHIERYFKSRRL